MADHPTTGQSLLCGEASGRISKADPAIVLGIAGFLLIGGQSPTADKDAIGLMLKRGQLPQAMARPYGYSDFTDPLGRFLDLLAAGAFDQARALQPAACASWLATRQGSAFSGKVWVWNTQLDLDELCTRP